jgi:hypothetical protein
LADSNASRAVAHFLDRFRSVLQCIAAVEVFSTGAEIGRQHSLGFVAHGSAANDRVSLPLMSPKGVVSFFLRIFVEYRVDVSTNLRVNVVSVTSYSYRLLTSDHRELLVFHWHPSGLSRFTRPHVHVGGAAPITLPVLHNGVPRSLDIGKAHLPTRQISPEDLVEFLIDDPVFAIEPRRIDWRRILERRRASADGPAV